MRNLVEEARQQLQDRLGYRFSDPSLLVRAVTHASAQCEGMPSNERLEFLGDAVLDLVVSERLFDAMPELSEGEMTVMKSAVVSRRTLARVGRSLGLPEFLFVDDGLKQRRTYPASMAANVYEAIVGAIFVDGGLESAREFLLRTLAEEMERAEAKGHRPNHKSILQERTQAEGKGSPRYSVLRSEGPDHRRRYLIVVRIRSQECGRGWGSTKRDAEQSAAKDALDKCYPGWAEWGVKPRPPDARA